MIPPKVRAGVIERAESRCERCGVWCNTSEGHYSLQHRRPRGMGGTKRPDTPDNLAFMCGSATTGCHGDAESMRLEAEEDGWLVPRGTEPADHPIKHHELGYVLLGADFTYKELASA